MNYFGMLHTVYDVSPLALMPSPPPPTYKLMYIGNMRVLRLRSFSIILLKFSRALKDAAKLLMWRSCFINVSWC